jgi:DNA polymerase III subunit epsilon
VRTAPVSALPAAPPRSGRGTPWDAAEYAALDFETTGLDYARDHVISFGVVPVVGGRVVVGGSVHRLVQPPSPPSPRSQTVHLLRPQDLSDAPPIEEAREALRDLLDRRYLLAWFADVELHFLARTFGGSVRRWRRRTIDVRNLMIAAAGEPAGARARPGFALHAAARRYGVPVTTPHDALDDALVTAQLLLVLVSKLPGVPRPTLRDLIRIAR